MSDKLDLFIESQKEANATNAETMKALANTVSQIKEDVIRFEAVDNDVTAVQSLIREMQRTIDSHSIAIEFVKGARKIFIAVLTAMVLAGGGVMWQVVSPTDSNTDKAILELLKDIKTSQTKTPGRQTN